MFGREFTAGPWQEVDMEDMERSKVRTKKETKTKSPPPNFSITSALRKGVGSRSIGRSTATKTRGKVGVLLPTSELGVPYVEMWFVNRSL